MQSTSFDKLGGIALIVGSVLFVTYSAPFSILLPIGSGAYDYVLVVLNPNWVRLALVAFLGILLKRLPINVHIPPILSFIRTKMKSRFTLRLNSTSFSRHDN